MGVDMGRPGSERLRLSPYKTFSYMKCHALGSPHHEVDTTGVLPKKKLKTTGIGIRLPPSFHLG